MAANRNHVLSMKTATFWIYRSVFPWFTPATKAAIEAGEGWNPLLCRAADEWKERFGLPVLGDDVDAWHTAALAAGFSQERYATAPFREIADGICAWAVSQLGPQPTGAGRKKQSVRRRPGTAPKPRPLTPRQVEVIQIVGECKGNIAEAATRLGRDRKTIVETYQAGMKKLGKDVSFPKKSDRLIARDRRGTLDVADIDDSRSENADEDHRRKYRNRR
jgi:hypothetical protein